MHRLCTLPALNPALKRIFACFSLFFILHAVTPGVLFGLSLFDGDSKSITQPADPIAEEEEDENSDAKLKFLPPHIATQLPAIFNTFFLTGEMPVSGFVEEIPTPPPLS